MFGPRTVRENRRRLRFALVSNDEGAVEIGRAKPAVFLHVQFDGFGQPIEAQAVFVETDDVEELTLQFLVLHQVDLAFKYGFLHALADGLAGAGDAAQAAAPLLGFGCDVVTDDDQHGLVDQRAMNGR